MAQPTQVLATLSPSDRAALTMRSDRAGLIHLAGHGGLIAALMTYVAMGLPLWWVAMVPLGIALAFLFTLQHECTHLTPFKTRALNELAGHACALVLIQPFLWFRAFHMALHKHTNDPDQDPELHGDAKPETWAAFVWHLSSLGYWGHKAQTLWFNAIGNIDPAYVSQLARTCVRKEARVLIAIYTLVALFTVTISPILIWVWLMPLVIGFPVLRLYLLAEHGRCPSVANMFENSRTTLTNRFVRFLAWNMPYHAEHHAYPNVPFHKLPTAHAVAKAHLGTISDGYASFTIEYTRDLNGTAGGAS